MVMNFPFYIARRISKSSTTGYSGALIKLAIFSISLSVAVMILSTAVIKGFKNEISEKIYGFWGNIHITDTHQTRNFELRPIALQKALIDSVTSIGHLEYMDKEGGKKYRTKGGVKAMSPFITYPAILNSKQVMEGIVLKGINADYDENIFDSYLRSGTFPGFKDSIASRQVLISRQTASRLKVDVGDQINIHFLEENKQIKRRLQVSGIYKTGLEEYDKKFAFIDLRILQHILDWDENQIGGYEIFVDHVEDSEPIADYIYNELLPANLYAETIQEKQSGIFEWLELQNINETMILLLMVLVAIINMSTAILILILERSTMIGILKSLGETNWGVRKIFIYNALYIMVLSLIIGNVLGLGVGWLQKKFEFLKLDEANYYLTSVPVQFDLASIGMINLGAVLVTAIAMLLPTFLVTRISPISILRFD